MFHSQFHEFVRWLLPAEFRSDSSELKASKNMVNEREGERKKEERKKQNAKINVNRVRRAVPAHIQRCPKIAYNVL